MCGGGGLGGIVNTIKKIDPLRGGDVILDKFGLPNLMGDKNGILNQTAEATSDTVSSALTNEEKSISTDVQAARDSEKRRRAAAAGLSSTILGGSVNTGPTATKTLLGS